MDKVVYSLLFIAFVVVVVIKVLQMENQLKTLLNVVMTLSYRFYFEKFFDIIKIRRELI